MNSFDQIHYLFGNVRIECFVMSCAREVDLLLTWSLVLWQLQVWQSARRDQRKLVSTNGLLQFADTFALGHRDPHSNRDL